MPFTYDYPMSSLAVDIILDTKEDIYMIRRLKDPFKDKIAFVGGFVEPDETFKEAALRELKEETGFSPRGMEYLEFVTILDRPNRDERSRVVSCVFRLELYSPPDLVASDDAKSIEVIPKGLHTFIASDFAFDHAEVLSNVFRDFFRNVGVC